MGLSAHSFMNNYESPGQPGAYPSLLYILADGLGSNIAEQGSVKPLQGVLQTYFFVCMYGNFKI